MPDLPYPEVARRLSRAQRHAAGAAEELPARMLGFRPWTAAAPHRAVDSFD